MNNRRAPGLDSTLRHYTLGSVPGGLRRGYLIWSVCAGAAGLVVSLAQAPHTKMLPAERQGSVTFNDAAPRSAFRYITNNSYTGRKYFQQPICGGVYDSNNEWFVFRMARSGGSRCGDEWKFSC